MVISSIDAIILREPGGSSDNETVLVVVEAEDGTRGYGEAVARSEAVVEVIRSTMVDPVGWDDGVRSALIGRDPGDPAALWRDLKRATFWSCRAGIGHVALAGVDMALWDLAGKLAGQPAWQLMGARRNESLEAYVTAYHGPAPFGVTLQTSLDALDRAVAAGFRAAKVEALPDTAPDLRDAVTLAARARERVGPDFTLLLDVGYRWQSFAEVRDLVKELDTFGLWALEAPFPPDQLDDHRRLADAIETPIATGDQLTAASEYLPLLDSGAVAVVQGGAGRTGASEMGILAAEAAARGRALVPWGWVPTTLSVAANLHRAVVHANVPLIEYRVPEPDPSAPLRYALAGPEPAIRDGRFELPTAPGLGVDVDLELVERLRVP
jgi:L-alanine-DL-glutamate epimerase-like enolase superfamily enzyme